jgi:DNA-binding transcriptional regulator YhcF (GntR family)
MHMENPKPIFLRIFGDTPKLRVMDYLIVNDDYDHSMKDIARNARVGYTTLKQFWKQLLKEEIIFFTRQVGKAKMYKLNKKNPIVKEFVKLHWTTVKAYVRKHIIKQKKITIKKSKEKKN